MNNTNIKNVKIRVLLLVSIEDLIEAPIKYVFFLFWLNVSTELNPRPVHEL